MVGYVYTLTLAARRWERVVEGGMPSRLAYSMGGALASWQMFPARPRNSSSVNLRDAQVVRGGARIFLALGERPDGHVCARCYVSHCAIRGSTDRRKSCYRETIARMS